MARKLSEYLRTLNSKKSMSMSSTFIEPKPVLTKTSDSALIERVVRESEKGKPFVKVGSLTRRKKF